MILHGPFAPPLCDTLASGPAFLGPFVFRRLGRELEHTRKLGAGQFSVLLFGDAGAAVKRSFFAEREHAGRFLIRGARKGGQGRF